MSDPRCARPWSVLLVLTMATTAVHAADPVPASALRPAGEWAKRVPTPAEYRHRLPMAADAAPDPFAARHGDLDPSDRERLHAALLAERQARGRDLDAAAAADFDAWLRRAEARAAALVAARAAHTGLPGGGVLEDGRAFALVGFRGTEPMYSMTANAQAAQSTGVHLVRQVAAFDPALAAPADGDGLYVNVNDHGTIYEHAEFQLPGGAGSRILYKEIYDSGDRNHMTHVAGTVGGWGYSAGLLGMAPRVWIRSHIQMSGSDITSHGMQWPGQRLAELNPRTGQAQMRSVMGTTSLGWDTHNDQYNSTAAYYDQVLWDHPYYIHFYAASNNGGGGMATLGDGEPHAKNIVTIGSVSDVTRTAAGAYSGGGGDSGFSSRGPGLDGRIKPDFKANGEGLTSTTDLTGSSSYSGTSMATPNASGSTTLLIDYITRRFPGHFLRADTLKALLAATADDRGTTGPDYTYGWGIINIHAAATLLRRQAEQPAARLVVEDVLAQGGSRSWTCTYDGSGPIRATLAWHDPAGTARADNVPVLVNNLDLRLVHAGTGTVYQPWVMPYTTGNGTYPAFSTSLYATAATTGNNIVDNVEQVAVAAPPAGTYTVQVTHTGTLSGASQRFSVVLSGLTRSGALAPALAGISPATADGSAEQILAVDGTDIVFGCDLVLRRTGSADVAAAGEIAIPSRLTGRVDTTAMAPGYWDAVVRWPDGTTRTLANAFLVPAGAGQGSTQTLYANTFESGATGLTLGTGWQVAAPDKGSVSGPATAQQGSAALVTYPGAVYAGGVTTYARLPSISTVGCTTITLAMQRWLGVVKQGGSTDYGRVQYSTDGTTWTTVTSHSNLIETRWAQQSYLLPAAAEGKAALHLRFSLETDANNHSFGWNIDDLKVTGVASAPAALPPVFTSVPPTTATVGQAFSYAVATSDADTAGSSLVLAATGLPSGLTFTPDGSGGGTVSGTPSTSGSAQIRLSVADGSYTTWQYVDLVILPPGGNTPPVVATTTLPDAHIGVGYSATVAATDADGHAITLTATGRPSWLGFSDLGGGLGLLSGTPAAGAQGSATIAVSASDGLQAGQRSLGLAIRPRAVLGLAAASVSVAETGGSVALTVRRTLNDAGVVSVAYATANGSAAAGSDYTATSGTLAWAVGDLTDRTITVPILDDLLTEGGQTFTVTLSGPAGIADLGIAAATVTITDNENNTAPTVTITRPAPALAGVSSTAVGLVLAADSADDGLPLAPGAVSRQWTMVSGPAAAVFAAATAEDTTVSFPAEGVYQLRLTVSDGEFSASDTVAVRVGPAPGISAGTGLLREVWSGISGTAVGNLTGAAAYPASPTSATVLTTGFEAPSSIGDNYGQRLSGWFIPPASGGYVFAIASDDASELWLSTTASAAQAVKIAEVTGYTGTREWTKYASQTSATVSLVAGQPYWIMALHKEGSGGDHLAVRAVFPDAGVHAPLEAAWLAAAAADVPANYGPVPVLPDPAAPLSGTPFALGGSVGDDGIPGGTPSVQYSQTAGPATLVLSAPGSLACTATAPVPGTYAWRLVADDGQIATWVERQAVVAANGANLAPELPVPAVADPAALALP